MPPLPDITFSSPSTAELCALHRELETECAAISTQAKASSGYRLTDEQLVRFESLRSQMDKIDRALGMRVRIEHQVQARIEQLTQAGSTAVVSRCG
jgi:hypothetical protein